MYLLGEKYVEAMRQIGESDNAKIVVLPCRYSCGGAAAL